jgi:creatinine amidohydrolase
MVELAQLTWPEAKQAIRATSVALLPVGSIEQHGPHLPLSTDLIIAEHIAAGAAAAPGLLLLPSLPVGVSCEHSQFWGTLTIPPDRLRDLALAIIRSASAHGLRKFVFVNGHGTNCAPLDDAARLLRGEGLPTYVFNWWQAVGSTLASLSLRPVDHAGPVETSLLLAMDPRLVRGSCISAAGRVGDWGTYVESVQVGFDAIAFSAEGNVGDPRSADAEKGAIVLREAVTALARFCVWLAGQAETDLAPPNHVP